jgi:hypothetical protein
MRPLHSAGAKDARSGGFFIRVHHRFKEVAMRTTQIHLVQSFRRVQVFHDGHADVVGTVDTNEARKQLDAAVSQIDAAVDAQGTRTRETRAEVNKRRQLERELIGKYMTPLATFARSKLVGVPDFGALTPSANDLRTERLMQSARAMAKAAAPLAVKIAPYFSSGFLQQFGNKAQAIQTSLDARENHRTARKNATTQIQVAVKLGRDAVSTLDGQIKHLIHGNAVLEDAWNTAKRVTQSTGVRHSTVPATVATPAVVTAMPAVQAVPATPAAAPVQEVKVA